jgi:NAD(P)-dependent dehydrogenase (short-subunit alcohol dehydrogenase family)
MRMEKTILITGAAGNLGKALVQYFLNAGATVIGTTLPHEKVDEFKENANFKHYVLDVTQEAAVRQFAKSMEGVSIDAAALTVGGFAMGGFNDTTEADLDKMISLNFKSAYFLSKELLALMSKQQDGGRLFLLGARPALQPEAGKATVAYALSKSLVFSLAELLNAEGQKHNVVTSVLVPSILDTPDNRNAMPDADFDAWVKLEDVASVIDYAIAASALREPVYKLYGKA